MGDLNLQPNPQETAWIWLAKILSGAFIIVLMAIHFTVNHLVAPGGLLSYNEILSYYSRLFVPLMEVAFLVIVVTHALIGVRSILLDLNPSARWLKIIDRALISLGAVSIVYGTWLIVIIAVRAAAV